MFPNGMHRIKSGTVQENQCFVHYYIALPRMD